MIKLKQRIESPTEGDCMRASIASVLELKLDQVPHLSLYKENCWAVFYYFMLSQGYKYYGLVHYNNSRGKVILDKTTTLYSIDDKYYLASVKSRSYPTKMGITHMVILDKSLTVVHDPHSNKLYQDDCLKESTDLDYIYNFYNMNSHVRNCYVYL